MKHRFHFRSVVTLANSQLSVKTAAVVLASSTLVSALLGIMLLVPNYLSGSTLSPESYLLLALWCILGCCLYCSRFLILPDYFRRSCRYIHSSLQSAPREWQQEIRLGTQCQFNQFTCTRQPRRIYPHYDFRRPARSLHRRARP